MKDTKKSVSARALERAKKEYKVDEGDVATRTAVFQLRRLYQKWLRILSIGRR